MWDWGSIADPIFGPLRKVVDLPRIDGEPFRLHCASAHLSRVGKYLDWTPEVQGSGSDFDRDRARSAAIGEAAERYSGNFKPVPDFVGSYAMMSQKGMSALDPRLLELFEHEQYREAGFPFKRPSVTEDYSWIEGYSVEGGEPVFLPYEAVILNAPTAGGSAFPTRVAGIAAGSDVVSAVDSGLRELIERDAIARWWNLGEPASPVNATDLLRALGVKLSQLEVRILLLQSASDDVHVVAAVAYDKKMRSPFIGFAARRSLSVAIQKALGEVYQLRRIGLALLDPGSWIWENRESGVSVLPVRAYRADRSYYSEFDSPVQMDQLVHNSQYFLDESVHADFEEHLREVMSGSGLRAADVKDHLHRSPAEVVSRMTKQLPNGIYYCDLSTEDFGRLGFHTVHVLAPDLIPNFPQAYLPLRSFRRFLRQGTPLYKGPLPHA